MKISNFLVLFALYFATALFLLPDIECLLYLACENRCQLMNLVMLNSSNADIHCL